MKFKSKIIISISTFALIFAFVSVTCFAYVSSIEVGKTYTFIENPITYDGQGLSYDFDVSGEILLEIDGSEFSSFSVGGNNITISNSDYIYYYYYDDSISDWRWDLEYADSGDVLRIDPITFKVVQLNSDISYHFINWLSGNVVLDSDSFYDQIFSSVSNAVFGGSVLSPEQNLSLSLISTVLSIGMVLLPVLLAIGFLLRCFRL